MRLIVVSDSLAFFKRFLEAMTVGKYPVLEQVELNLWSIFPTEKPRRIAYAVFSTPPEYAVMLGKERIGHLPMTVTFRVGETFVPRGGRWRILNVNDENRTIQVTRAPTAGAPRYGGTPQAPSGLVAKRMRELLASKTSVTKIIEEDDQTTRTLLNEGRKAFYRAYELRMDTLVTHPIFGYRVSYRRLLEVQVRLLAKVLDGDIGEYPVFVTR